MRLVELLENAKSIRFLIYEGKEPEALALLQQLRDRFKIHESPSLVGYLQLAEGLLLQHSGDWVKANDCFRRSDILARLARNGDLMGLARSWESHGDFNLGRYEDSARIIVEISPTFQNGSAEFQHRYCLVVAQILAFVGDWGSAQTWFDRARVLAGDMGSRGLFSATIYNQFAMRIWNSLLVSRLGLGVLTVDPKGEIGNLYSALNYDGLTGVSNRPVLHKLLYTQAIGAAGEHAEAIAVLTDLLDDLDGFGSTDIWRVRLEFAWNVVASGALDVRNDDVRKVLDGCFERLVDDDELSLAHSIYAEISRVDGDKDMCGAHAEAAEHYRVRLQRRRVETLEILRSAVFKH